MDVDGQAVSGAKGGATVGEICVTRLVRRFGYMRRKGREVVEEKRGDAERGECTFRPAFFVLEAALEEVGAGAAAGFDAVVEGAEVGRDLSRHYILG